jgi:hypothetical protein
VRPFICGFFSNVVTILVKWHIIFIAKRLKGDVSMTQNINPPNASEVGYLTVRVSTANGAIPLQNASVNISGGDVDDSAVLYSLTTNSDGLTPTVSLSTPPRSASESPQSTAPSYAVYNVDVYANGYIPAFFHNVPVFSGINSVQPAILVPRLSSSSQNETRHVTETGNEDVEGEIYDR